MFVRWQQYRSQRPRWLEPDKRHALLKATLVESVRVDGKPRQKHISFLGSIALEYMSRRDPQGVFLAPRDLAAQAFGQPRRPGGLRTHCRFHCREGRGAAADGGGVRAVGARARATLAGDLEILGGKAQAIRSLRATASGEGKPAKICVDPRRPIVSGRCLFPVHAAAHAVSHSLGRLCPFAKPWWIACFLRNPPCAATCLDSETPRH
jgi:hypothetical protein